ncbi:hypothetical protein BH10ACI1_BH10ACI1_02090 [soil metagenome]
MSKKRKFRRFVKDETPIVKTEEKSKRNLFGYLKSNWLVVLIIAVLSLGAFGAGLKYLEDDAKREIARRAENKGKLSDDKGESLLNRINPFLPAPLPSPTPQLSKELIYSGQKLVAVEDADANAAPPADLAIWRPSSGYWWVMGGQGSQQTSQGWGTNGDDPVEGDYDGDGKTDFCVFRADSSNQTGTWYLIYSSTGGTNQIQYGLDTDKPAQADFDGDGKTDIAVFRWSNTTWYIYQSSTSSTVSILFGASGDTPIPSDFDGDGKADAAVWRNSAATFYSKNSSNGQTITTAYGATNDKPACGDYDGDGKADLSVWRTSNTTWYYKKSSDGSTTSYQWGNANDIPVQNDYDGDGKVDMALWRAVETYSGAGDVGRWYIYQSSNSQIRQETWGISGDTPVPAYYRR